MSHLTEVWDKYNPTFLLETELHLKKSISLQDIAKRTCIELCYPSEYVALSYDEFFIRFNNLDASKIQEYITHFTSFWASLSQQLHYDRYYQLKVYGVFYDSYLSPKKPKYVIALGQRYEVVEDLQEVNVISYQKAIQGSYLALPF